MGSTTMIGQRDFGEQRLSKKRKTEATVEPKEETFKMMEEPVENIDEQVELTLTKRRRETELHRETGGLSCGSEMPSTGKSQRLIEGAGIEGQDEEEPDAGDEQNLGLNDDGLDALSEMITFELSQQHEPPSKLNLFESGQLTDSLLQSAIEALLQDDPSVFGASLNQSTEFNSIDDLEKQPFDQWPSTLIEGGGEGYLSGDEWKPSIISEIQLPTTSSNLGEAKDLDETILELLLNSQQPTTLPTDSLLSELDARVPSLPDAEDGSLVEDW